MSRPYRAYNPEQVLLLPPSLRDWVPEGDLSHFISDTVDVLDLSGFEEHYRADGKGNVPYDPRMMLKVLIYGYSSGVFSSRKIAKSMERDVAFRMLGAGNFPNFRSINRFRLEHLERFGEIFVEVVRLAQEAGLVKLGIVAIDGTKMKANASKHKAMSYERMGAEEKRLKGEIGELLRQAQEVDEREDIEYGADKRGDELPDELQRRESRLKTIREAKARLEERQRTADKEAGREDGDDKSERGGGKRGRKFKRQFGEPDAKKQDNFTDPESRIMKTSDGFQQCYNAQTAVDEEEQIIIAADVGNNASDCNSLLPMTDQVEENTGRKPKQVLADSGYKSEENFEGMKEREIKAFVSLGREGKDEKKKIRADLKLTKAMKRRLEGTRGRKTYRKRKGIVEPPFGWIKKVLGFVRFSLRGLEKVKAEWKLMCLAMNLKRMNQMIEWKTA